MYKNKGLKRSYIFAYINVLFGLMIPVLLAYRVHVALMIVMLLIVLCELAALIVSHVFYAKDDNLYHWTGLGAVIGFGALTLVGLIWEIVYTAQGLAANYAWMILVLNIISAALLGLFYYLDWKKKINRNAELALRAKEKAELEGNK